MRQSLPFNFNYSMYQTKRPSHSIPATIQQLIVLSNYYMFFNFIFDILIYIYFSSRYTVLHNIVCELLCYISIFLSQCQCHKAEILKYEIGLKCFSRPLGQESISDIIVYQIHVYSAILFDQRVQSFVNKYTSMVANVLSLLFF